MPPTTSIIIVSYNSATQIGACLRALQQQRCAGEYEIVVVDNASRDASAAIVAGFSNVRLIAADENWGFAGGVNRGVAAAHSRVIALLNPDAEPAPNWPSTAPWLNWSSRGTRHGRDTTPSTALRSWGSPSARTVGARNWPPPVAPAA